MLDLTDDQRKALAATELARMTAFGSKLRAAIADESEKPSGHVQQFDNGLCINHEGTVGGVLFANLYTLEQQEVMAYHSIGVPRYVNGHGEPARWVTRRKALERSLKMNDDCVALLAEAAS